MRCNAFKSLCRFAQIAGATLLLTSAVSAYTIVLRDGRRLEVSNEFIVTRTTFTYEAAPGINKTLQLTLIDVAATERANNETPGSFFKHGPHATNLPSSSSSAQHAQWTLSNRDLEAFRWRRIESEKNYEKRRIELGLPSIEDTRRRQAEEEEQTLALARQRRIDNANDEAYWRQRAADLRNQIAEVDAQINYLSSQQRLAPFVANPAIPFVFTPNVRQIGRLREPEQGTMWAPRAGSPNQNLVNTGVRALPSPGRARPFSNFGARFRQFGFAGFYGTYGVGDELNSLLVRRAGLNAAWQQLEDEARRANVPQIWLLP